MARQLAKALAEAGFKAELASRLRSFSAEPNGEHLRQVKQQAAAEIQRILAAYTANPAANNSPTSRSVFAETDCFDSQTM